MKKYISIILFPYFAAINVFSILASGSLTNFPKIISFFICLIFISANVIELFFSVKCIINIVRDAFSNNTDSDLINKIICIKFLHIPAYIFIFVYGCAMITLPLGFIISIFCFIADCWNIFLTGLPMTLALVVKYRQKEISNRFTVIHSIFAFIFCLDIIDGVYLKRKFFHRVKLNGKENT